MRRHFILLLSFGSLAWGWPSGYTKTFSLTVAAGMVTQNPFQAYFAGRPILQASPAGCVMNANGYDVIFASDPGGTSLLNFELVSGTYNGSTGAGEWWINGGSLGTGTIIYGACGNSSVNTFQGNVSSTWPSPYVSVWHLGNGTALSGSDSSGGHTMTNAGGVTAASGQVSGAGAFGATNGYMSSAGYSLSATPMVFTFTAWVKIGATALSGQRNTLFSTTSSEVAGNWWVELGNASGRANSVSLCVPGSVLWQTYSLAGSAFPTDGNWHLLVITRNGTGDTPIVYYDGVAKSWYVHTPADFTDAGGVKQIGRRGTSVPQLFAGSIDQVTYSSVVHDANWIAAIYANQATESTFWTVSGLSDITVVSSAAKRRIL